MRLRFFDLQDESNAKNGRALKREADVLDTLNGLRNRAPFFAELVGENGYKLMIGIGTTACVQYSLADGNPPYQMAVKVSDPEPQGSVQYLISGTLTEVSKRYGLPFHVVSEIACHFQRTGEPSPAVAWEEI